MKHLLILICLISLKLSAQVTRMGTPGRNYWNWPEGQYAGMVNRWLNPNRNTQFSENAYAFDLEDFDLRKDRAVKSVSIDMNTDALAEYALNFDRQGRIILIEDYVENAKTIVEYRTDLTILTKTYTRGKNEIFSVFSDSISYGKNRNVIRHSYMRKDSETYGGGFIYALLENRYADSGQLKEKYYYYKSAGLNSAITEETVNETFYQYGKDSITAKLYSVSARNGLPAKRNIASPKTLLRTTISYLDSSGSIHKILNLDANPILNEQLLLKYSSFGRISELAIVNRKISEHYTYDSSGRILSYREDYPTGENGSYKCEYDSRGRFAAMLSKDEKSKVLPRTYTYDQYGNWTAVISESYLKDQTFQKKSSRTILYY